MSFLLHYEEEVPESSSSSTSPANSTPTYSSPEVSGITVTVEQAGCLPQQLAYTEYAQPPLMGYSSSSTSPANSTPTCSPNSPDTSGLAVEQTAYVAAPQRIVYPEFPLAYISETPLFPGQQKIFYKSCCSTKHTTVLDSSPFQCSTSSSTKYTRSNFDTFP